MAGVGALGVLATACQRGVAVPLATPSPTATPVPDLAIAPSPTLASVAEGATALAEDVPVATATSLAGRQVLITPNDDFYLTYYKVSTLKVDMETWRLGVGGAVDHPLSLAMAEIRARPSITEMRTLECISNPVGGNLIGNAVWTGTSLRDLLEEVGVQPGAVELRVDAADGFSTSVPIELAMHEESWLVYEMNGLPLPENHGFPLRVMYPGRYGMKQPKWITRLTILTKPYLGYWEQQGWSNEARIKINSQIRRPGSGEQVTEETYVIEGAAFSDESGVERVDVSTDGGETWVPAELTRGPSPYVWTEWRYAWTPGSDGRYTLQARATDKAGRTQTETFSRLLGGTFPDGTSGIHSLVAGVKRGS